MPDSYRYKAFLSYSHADLEPAIWLHRAIERYRVPKRIRDIAGCDRIHPVFRDSDELPTSTDLSGAIQEALRESESLIVLCSPDAANSAWVNDEIRLFKSFGRQDKIHCVIVGGHKDEPIDGLVPSEIQSREDGDKEPVAADARSHADGKDQAKIKLLAGLLGIGVDGLRNREMQRRHRRWMVLSSGLVAGLLTMTALVVITVASREQAVQAERQAAVQAETARQVTDFLIEQFEVSDPGVIRGNSVTAREILERSVLRLDSLKAQPLVQARLMQTIGRAYTKLGLYEEALPMLTQSLEVRQERLGRSHVQVGSSLADLAELNLAKGAFEVADQLFTEALIIMEVGEDADELELTPILDGLGVLYSHGIPDKHDESELMFKRSLKIRERFLPPDHPDVLNSKSMLAARYDHVGRYDEAITLYEDALQNYERVFGPDHPRVAWTLNALAWHYSRLGESQKAERFYTRAMQIREKVYGGEHPELAWTQYDLASHYLKEKDLQKAEALFIAALAILDARFGPRGKRVGVPWYLGGLESRYATLLRITGREEEARLYQE